MCVAAFYLYMTFSKNHDFLCICVKYQYQSSLIEFSCIADLKNTDLNSEIFMKKLHRAHEALSQSDGSGTSSVKTLSASFGTKWPYKRTMSAPASMIPRQDTKQGMYINVPVLHNFLLSPFRAPHRLCCTLCVIFFLLFSASFTQKRKRCTADNILRPS